MNDRYGWDDRNDGDRYRRQSAEGTHRSDQQPSRGQDRWRSEDEDWRSRSSFGPDHQHHDRSDFDRGQRQGGGNYGGGQQNYAGQRDSRQAEGGQRRYSSSGYGYGVGQAGDTPQPYFTGQQQGWEVPSSYGAPGTFGASYGGGSGSYGGGAGGAEGYGEDYRERGRDQSRSQPYGSGQHERGFLQRAGDEIASWFGDDDAARRREQDHRGRGPAGYTRSDERIREDANDRLTEDSWVDASSISVTVEAGEVTLNGTVSRREDKRRAEDIVDAISGVKHVQNNLRVQQATAWSGGASAGTASSSGTTTGSGTGAFSSATGTSTGSATASATGAKDATTKDGANTAPT